MQPTIIQGPAYISSGGLFDYTEGEVILDYVNETWEPEGAITGKLGPRHKSRAITVSYTPVGEVEALNLQWPYTPANIGGLIIAATPLSIIPLVGNKVTFPMSGLTKMSALNMAPTKTAWGPKEWTCLGDPTKEITDAAYWQTLAAVGGGEGAADTHFDETKVISPRYTGAWGAAPFDLIEAEDGFIATPSMEVKPMAAANYGVIAIALKSLGLTVSCVPLNQTEANYATLLRLQGASAVLPGQTYSNPADDRDLVITGTGLSFTGKHMGVGNGGMRYGTGIFRQGECVWHTRRTWTGGSPDPLWVLA